MTNEQATEAPGDWPLTLRSALAEAVSLARQTDTADLLATVAADGLRARADLQEGRINSMKEPATQQDREKLEAQYERMVAFARAEVKLQRRIAGWLHMVKPKGES